MPHNPIGIQSRPLGSQTLPAVARQCPLIALQFFSDLTILGAIMKNRRKEIVAQHTQSIHGKKDDH